MANSLCSTSSDCGRCAGARLAAFELPAQRRKKASGRGLAALFAPGILFGTGLLLLAQRGGPWSWLRSLSTWPWELWLIAVAGSIATLAGAGDWIWHRWARGCVVSRGERRCEFLAMAGGGGPLFLFMAAASLSERPMLWLLPAVAVVIATTVMICYDEFIFHRKRCRRWETLLHRMLVFGQGTAWMAWAHWCFVRGGAHALG